ncbi:perlucin-like [Diorhabda carinulata]|uniref:perlucin-like n=1 Tax=Diorhabda carinulata TaxID=1163345 RepID=UPI0025A2366A|nr:perlucin-like [Diorhabda carinulata]
MIFVIFLFSVLFNPLTVTLGNDSEFVSPVLTSKKNTPNWFSFAGKTYYVDTVFKANFYKSLQFCRQQGMHLLSINSQQENDRIGKFIQDSGLSYGHYWTSASNLAGDNEWVWLSTGQNMRYANWYPGEPSGKNSQNNSENCVEARHWAQPSGFTWNDIDCLSELYFICESIVDCPSSVPKRRKK